MIKKINFKWDTALINLFYITFFLLFGWITLNVFFMNVINERSAFINLVYIAVAFMAMIIANRLVHIFEAQLKKFEIIFLVIIFVILFIADYFSCIHLYVEPVWDFGAMYYGAIDWLETGSLGGYTQYFCMFANMRGAIMFLRALFGIVNLFGFKNFYMTAAVTNILLINATFFLIYLITKRLLGFKKAVLSLLLCIMMFSFFFLPSVFYTDTLSMVFVPLTFYLYLVARDKKGYKQILFFILAGVACAFGGLIKGSALIIGLAVLIEILFFRRNKLTVAGGFAMIATTILVFSVTGAIFAACMLNEQDIDKYNIPTTHWVFMGLAGNGAYNPADYEFTKNIETLSERKKGVNEQIIIRLKEMGIKGYLQLINRKSLHSYGRGCMHELSNTPKEGERMWLHELILHDGKHTRTVNMTIQGFHLCFLGLAAISAYISFKTKKHYEIFAPRLAFFGLFIFFMLWEANPRLLTNYYPLLAFFSVMVIDGGYRTRIKMFFKAAK